MSQNAASPALHLRGLRKSFGAVTCVPSNESVFVMKPLMWLCFPVRITARLGPQMEFVQ